MDPNANLREQRELAASIIDRVDGNAGGTDDLPIADADQTVAEALRLSELVQALDEWRLSGGFDPYPASMDIVGPNHGLLVGEVAMGLAAIYGRGGLTAPTKVEHLIVNGQATSRIRITRPSGTWLLTVAPENIVDPADAHD